MLSTVILALAATASASIVAERQSACSATHIFLAKGNNEPYPGRQGKLVNAICDGLTSCDYEDILYYNPADSVYCDSVNEGVANGIAQITTYSQRCPDSKLVMSGYSQGAQIVSDILAGRGGLSGDCQQTRTAGLDPNSAPGKNIAAALVFGNPRHTAGQPYNVLTGANSNGAGRLPSSSAQLAALSAYTSVFHDYCVATDPLCAGGDDISTHLNYFEVYTDVAAAWVKSQLLSAASKPSTSKAATTFVPSTSTGLSGSLAPYPTASTYNNGTATTAFSVPAIPTATITYYVTVPCASVNTAEVASFVSSYSASVASSAYTTSAAIPTAVSSGATNGTQPTQAVFAGSASSMTSSLGMVSLAIAGFLVSLM